MRSTATIVTLLALVVAGCGAADEQDVSANDNAITAAAAKTSAQHTAHMTLEGTAEVAGQSADTTGDGLIDFDHQASSITTTVKAAGESVEAQAVLSDAVLYLKLPSEASTLPGGKQWASIDLDKALHGSFSDALSSGSDPSQYLKLLAGSGSVQKVGAEEVAGFQTTHYKAVIDYQQLAESGPKNLRALAEQSLKFSASSTVPVEVWIDENGLVRQQKLHIETKDHGQIPGQTQDMTITLDRYGVDVSSIKAPPADETEDLTDEASSALDG